MSFRKQLAAVVAALLLGGLVVAPTARADDPQGNECDVTPATTMTDVHFEPGWYIVIEGVDLLCVDYFSLGMSSGSSAIYGRGFESYVSGSGLQPIEWTNERVVAQVFDEPWARSYFSGRTVLGLAIIENGGSPPPEHQYAIPGGHPFVDDSTPSTYLISATPGGLGGDGNSGNSINDLAVSDDGRFVAFSSYASDLVAGDANGEPDVFLRDRASGSTSLVDLDSSGQQASTYAYQPSISGDGRHVAFTTAAGLDPVADLNGTIDAYVRDLDAGTTVLASIAADGTQGNGHQTSLDISGDGRYVLFQSYDGTHTAGRSGIFVRDRDGDGNGTFDEPGTSTSTRLDVASDGTPGHAYQGWISPNGRYVGFPSDAAELGAPSTCTTFGEPGDPPAPRRCLSVFLHDRDPDADSTFDVDATTTIVSVGPGGEVADNDSGGGSVSDTGDVAFWSYASSLGGPGGRADVYVHDDLTGTDHIANAIGNLPAISGDGRYVAFDSSQPNGVASDTNGVTDVFLFDRVADVASRVSLDPSGAELPEGSFNPAVSGDGRFVAFGSYASSMAPAGSPAAANVFLRDRTDNPPTDSDGPAISIAAPVDGEDLSLGQLIASSYSCVDGSGVATCDGPVASGEDVDTSTAGTHTFTVNATDGLGNASSASSTYEVLAGDAEEAVTGGETVTTDPGGVGATPAVPVQTQIEVPSGVSGTLSITPEPSNPAPAGFVFFGQQIDISGPEAPSAADPYVVTFTVDATALGGTAPADVQVFRNGTVVSGCTAPSAAIPNPCVEARGFVSGGGGDAFITVRTTQFSDWNLGLQIGLRVDDLTVSEGASAATVTVRLSAPVAGTVRVQVASKDGTAGASDYKAKSATLTFAPGQRTASFPIELKGDKKRETTETFTVLLSKPVGTVVLDGSAVVTILDDD